MSMLRVQMFFFEAMMKGWATSPEKHPIPGLPGSKSITYEDAGLKLVDYYFVSKLPPYLTYGTTVIYEFGNPVWVMHYGGDYDKRVIPFLKSVLMRNYQDKVFVGGRGPERLEGEDHTLQYLNNVEEKSSFIRFRGHEQIITTSEQWKVPVGQKMGEHWYFGGIL